MGPDIYTGHLPFPSLSFPFLFLLHYTYYEFLSKRTHVEREILRESI